MQHNSSHKHSSQDESMDDISAADYCFDTSDGEIHESNSDFNAFQFTDADNQSIFVPVKEINVLLNALINGTASSNVINLFHEYCGKYIRPRVTPESTNGYELVPLGGAHQQKHDISQDMKLLLEMFSKMSTEDWSRIKEGSKLGSEESAMEDDS